jgi:hypothetical protein
MKVGDELLSLIDTGKYRGYKTYDDLLAEYNLLKKNVGLDLLCDADIYEMNANQHFEKEKKSSLNMGDEIDLDMGNGRIEHVSVVKITPHPEVPNSVYYEFSNGIVCRNIRLHPSDNFAEGVRQNFLDNELPASGLD